MLDLTLYSSMAGRHPLNSRGGCKFCEQGPVITGDGFLMNRCMNCGSWQHHDNGIPKFQGLRASTAKFFKAIRQRFLLRPSVKEQAI